MLGGGVVAEVRCCSSIGDDLTAIAIALLGIQAVCAAMILTMAMRQSVPAGRRTRRSEPPPGVPALGSRRSGAAGAYARAR